MHWLTRSLGPSATLSIATPLGRVGLGSMGPALCVLLAALLSIVVPSLVRAQAKAPLDLQLTARELSLIPLVPADFADERVGKVRFRFHPSTQNLTRRLESRLPAALRKVTDELGIAREQELEVRIARGPREMAALTPQSSPPPAYAVGVAYPALGLIVLSVVDPQSWFPPNLPEVLTHELSHVCLYRAAGERHLPLWFVEGLAVHQAGEHRLQRIQTLWEAAVVDDVLPIASLSSHFPSRLNQVNLAYAQSADLIEHMLHSPVDKARLAELLVEVKAGATFDQALLATYHIDLAYLERDWRHSLGERYRVLPMLLTGTALWGGIALLAMVAFIRRRKQQRERLAHWAAEEAREDLAREQLPLAPMLSQAPTSTEPELFVVVTHPRDSAIPTIEHEGQRYTLH